MCYHSHVQHTHTALPPVTEGPCTDLLLVHTVGDPDIHVPDIHCNVLPFWLMLAVPFINEGADEKYVVHCARSVDKGNQVLSNKNVVEH